MRPCAAITIPDAFPPSYAFSYAVFSMMSMQPMLVSLRAHAASTSGTYLAVAVSLRDSSDAFSVLDVFVMSDAL